MRAIMGIVRTDTALTKREESAEAPGASNGHRPRCVEAAPVVAEEVAWDERPPRSEHQSEAVLMDFDRTLVRAEALIAERPVRASLAPAEMHGWQLHTMRRCSRTTKRSGGTGGIPLPIFSLVLGEAE